MHGTRSVLTTADHAGVVLFDPGLLCGLERLVRSGSHGHVRFSRTVHVTVHGCEGVLLTTTYPQVVARTRDLHSRREAHAPETPCGNATCEYLSY